MPDKDLNMIVAGGVPIIAAILAAAIMYVFYHQKNNHTPRYSGQRRIADLQHDQVHEEVLLLFEHLSSQMNLAKENQWKTAYYGLLLDFGVMAIIATDFFRDPKLIFVKWAMVSVLVISLVFQVFSQATHRGAISTNRKILWELEGFMTRDWTNPLLKLAGRGDYKPYKGG